MDDFEVINRVAKSLLRINYIYGKTNLKYFIGENSIKVKECF